MEHTLTPGWRHRMGRIPDQNDAAGGQAVKLEIAPDVRLIPHTVGGCQFKYLPKLGRQSPHALEDAVQLFALAGRLEPVLGMADVFGVRLHEHPEETTRYPVGEGVVQSNEANKA